MPRSSSNEDRCIPEALSTSCKQLRLEQRLEHLRRSRPFCSPNATVLTLSGTQPGICRHVGSCAGFWTPAITKDRRAPLASVQKAPRHEVAGSWTPAKQRALCGFNVGAALDGKRDTSARRRHVCIPKNRRECSGAISAGA